jgi:hypothetical protein
MFGLVSRGVRDTGSALPPGVHFPQRLLLYLVHVGVPGLPGQLTRWSSWVRPPPRRWFT